ncbi:DUF2209 domain-containing protein [Methanosalsum natronophilum]|uniref:DUF2209 domain-containing protein n=1 Tax=Methanosalsum natronophilum TaxID=768733 RepID=A0A3R7VTZ2_9EURY|nr:MAG: DUF2209 domain-containing protein [Methanosalsum natronophilum]
MRKIIAVDISGRHKTSDDKYHLVCAAVAVSISPNHIERVHHVNTKYFVREKSLEIMDVVHLMEETVNNIDTWGTIVAEMGDLYNKPVDMVSKMFNRNFKYQESISERLAIQFAHHISHSSRKLLLNKEI